MCTKVTKINISISHQRTFQPATANWGDPSGEVVVPSGSEKACKTAAVLDAGWIGLVGIGANTDKKRGILF